MKIEDIVEAIKELGHDLPDDIVGKIERKLHGEPQHEWSGAQRKVLRKAAERALKEYSDRFDAKAYHVADDVVESLWRSGWELQIRYNQSVVGIEVAVKNFVENNYPEKLSQTDLDDPYLVEIVKMFQECRHSFSEQGLRAFLRAKDHLPLIHVRNAMYHLIEHGKDESYWTAGRIVHLAKQIQEQFNQPKTY